MITQNMKDQHNNNLLDYHMYFKKKPFKFTQLKDDIRDSVYEL